MEDITVILSYITSILSEVYIYKDHIESKKASVYTVKILNLECLCFKNYNVVIVILWQLRNFYTESIKL